MKCEDYIPPSKLGDRMRYNRDLMISGGMDPNHAKCICALSGLETSSYAFDPVKPDSMSKDWLVGRTCLGPCRVMIGFEYTVSDGVAVWRKSLGLNSEIAEYAVHLEIAKKRSDGRYLALTNSHSPRLFTLLTYVIARRAIDVMDSFSVGFTQQYMGLMTGAGGNKKAPPAGWPNTFEQLAQRIWPPGANAAERLANYSRWTVYVTPTVCGLDWPSNHIDDRSYLEKWLRKVQNNYSDMDAKVTAFNNYLKSVA